MDELKLVLESLKTLGEAGISAFVWYVIIVSVTQLLKVATGCGAFFLVVRLIVREVHHSVVQDINKAKIEAIRHGSYYLDEESLKELGLRKKIND